MGAAALVVALVEDGVGALPAFVAEVGLDGGAGDHGPLEEEEDVGLGDGDGVGVVRRAEGRDVGLDGRGRREGEDLAADVDEEVVLDVDEEAVRRVSAWAGKKG